MGKRWKGVTFVAYRLTRCAGSCFISWRVLHYRYVVVTQGAAPVSENHLRVISWYVALFVVCCFTWSLIRIPRGHRHPFRYSLEIICRREKKEKRCWRYDWTQGDRVLPARSEVCWECIGSTSYIAVSKGRQRLHSFSCVIAPCHQTVPASHPNESLLRRTRC